MNAIPRFPILLFLSLGLVLGLAACGGDDDDGTAPTQSADDNADEPETDADGDQDDGSVDADDDRGGGSDIAQNTAVVTVGDTRYEFAMSGSLTVGTTVKNGVCVALFGAIGGGGYDPDGREVDLEIDLPPEDWESSSEDWSAPFVRVDDDEDGVSWRAGGDVIEGMADVEPGMSQVDSFTSDGEYASGTATFVDINTVLAGGTPEPVQGTFEIRCE